GPKAGDTLPYGYSSCCSKAPKNSSVHKRSVMIESKSKTSGESVTRPRSVHGCNLECRYHLGSRSVCDHRPLLSESDNNLFKSEVFSQPSSEPARLFFYVRRLAQQGTSFVFVGNEQVNAGKIARLERFRWSGRQNCKCPERPGQSRSVKCGRDRNLECNDHQLCLRENRPGTVNFFT